MVDLDEFLADLLRETTSLYLQATGLDRDELLADWLIDEVLRLVKPIRERTAGLQLPAQFQGSLFSIALSDVARILEDHPVETLSDFGQLVRVFRGYYQQAALLYVKAAS